MGRHHIALAGRAVTEIAPRSYHARRRKMLRQKLDGSGYRSMSRAELIAEIERLQEELAELRVTQWPKA